METIPTELKYTVTHEWVRDEGDGIFSVGLTDPAQDLLGTIVNVDLPTEGDSLNAGEDCAVLESRKTTNDIFMPLSGEIVAINEDLESQPELINSDPYGEGWLFQIKISDPNEINDLLDATSYYEMLQDIEDDYDEDEEIDD